MIVLHNTGAFSLKTQRQRVSSHAEMGQSLSDWKPMRGNPEQPIYLVFFVFQHSVFSYVIFLEWQSYETPLVKDGLYGQLLHRGTEEECNSFRLYIRLWGRKQLVSMFHFEE